MTPSSAVEIALRIYRTRRRGGFQNFIIEKACYFW